MLKKRLFDRKFIVLFGLYYKLNYLCSAIRMKSAKSDLAAGGKIRHERVVITFLESSKQKQQWKKQ